VYPVRDRSGAITRYRGEITLDGVVHRPSAPTEALAWAKLSALQKGEDPAQAREPVDTVESWTRAYLSKQRARLRPKTLFGYQRSAELYIYREIGSVPLSDLARADVLRLVERMRAVGLSASRIHNTLAPLSLAMDEAVDQGKARANPARRIKVGDRGDGFAVAGGWSERRVKGILDAFVGHDYYDIYALLVFMGCRIGELLALDWSSVRLAEAEIDVHRTTSWEWDADGSGLHASFGDPKTKAGRRTVALPVNAVKLLWTRYHIMGDPKAGLVFPSKMNKRSPIPHGLVLRRWHEGLRRADLPDMRLHDLRHIAISRAIAAGVDVALVAHRAGHKNAAITLSLYTHADEERARAAAQTANLFEPGSKPPTMPGAAVPQRTGQHPDAAQNNLPDGEVGITSHGDGVSETERK
jgi:integrase